MNEILSAVAAIETLAGEQGIALLVLFAAVLLTVVGSAGLFRTQDSVQRRFGQISGALPTDEPVSIRHRDHKMLRRFEHYLVPRNDEEKSRIRLRLAQAGYGAPNAVRGYYLVRIVLALGLPLAFSVPFPLLSRELTFEVVLVLMLASGLFGFIAPSFWLDLRTRTRQRAIREGFPDALDMLLVCVEAGLGLDAALARVATEIGSAHPVLAEEFTILALELRAGKPRDAVLQDMGRRTGVDEVSSFVTVLIHSSRFGTSIADALRVFAADMRLRRMMRAEEKANQLPVKLSIVLVLCTLPAMFVVILGPGAIQMLRLLSPAMAGGS